VKDVADPPREIAPVHVTFQRGGWTRLQPAK
jgi:hypothetical protein